MLEEIIKEKYIKMYEYMEEKNISGLVNFLDRDFQIVHMNGDSDDLLMKFILIVGKLI